MHDFPGCGLKLRTPSATNTKAFRSRPTGPVASMRFLPRAQQDDCLELELLPLKACYPEACNATAKNFNTSIVFMVVGGRKVRSSALRRSLRGRIAVHIAPVWSLVTDINRISTIPFL